MKKYLFIIFVLWFLLACFNFCLSQVTCTSLTSPASGTNVCAGKAVTFTGRTQCPEFCPHIVEIIISPTDQFPHGWTSSSIVSGCTGCSMPPDYSFSISCTIPENTVPGSYYWWAYCPISDACGGSNTGCNNSAESHVIIITSACLPTTLNCAGSTETSISLSWTPVSGAMNYDVRYRPSGSNNWTTIYNIQGSSFTIFNLECDTWYDFQIKSHCSACSSDWSPTRQCKTDLCPCGKPIIIDDCFDVTQSTIKIKWNAVNGATSYNVHYRITSQSGWTLVNNILDLFYTATGLNSNTEYEFQVQANCGTSSSSWSDSKFCRTSISCNVPSWLSCETPPQETFIKINWDAEPTATYGYEIQYKESAVSEWSNSYFTGNTTYTFYFLHSNTSYDFQVRSRCDDAGGTSDWIATSCSTCGPPGCVNYSSPDNGMTGVSTTPTFTWTVGAGGPPDYFQLFLGTDINDLPLYQDNITDTYFTVSSPLLPNVKYYWKVKPINSCQSQSPLQCNEVWNFTTSVNLDGMITILQPITSSQWAIGGTEEVKWNWTGNSAVQTKISLYKNPAQLLTFKLTYSNIGDNRTLYPIPAMAAPGNDYYIKMTIYSKEKTSDPFSLISAPLLSLSVGAPEQPVDIGKQYTFNFTVKALDQALSGSYISFSDPIQNNTGQTVGLTNSLGQTLYQRTVPNNATSKLYPYTFWAFHPSYKNSDFITKLIEVYNSSLPKLVLIVDPPDVQSVFWGTTYYFDFTVTTPDNSPVEGAFVSFYDPILDKLIKLGPTPSSGKLSYYENVPQNKVFSSYTFVFQAVKTNIYQKSNLVNRDIQIIGDVTWWVKSATEINPDLDLYIGDPYLFSISVDLPDGPYANFPIEINDGFINDKIERTTNSKGECLYTGFIPKSTIPGQAYTFKFSIKGCSSCNSVIKTLTPVAPIKPDVPDETDNMGPCPTTIITGNGKETSGFSKEGKLISWYTPTVGSWNVIPYRTSTPIDIDYYKAPFLGAREYEGVFGGIELDGMFIWLYQIPFPEISYDDEKSPLIKYKYTIPFRQGNVFITLKCIAGYPNSVPASTMIISYDLLNTTKTSRETSFIFYGLLHPTKKNQQPPLKTAYDPDFGFLFKPYVDWIWKDPEITQLAIANNSILNISPAQYPGQYICLGATMNTEKQLLSFNNYIFDKVDESSKYSGVFSNEMIDFSSGYKNTFSSTTVNFALKYNLGQIADEDSKTLNIFLSADKTTLGNASNHLNAIVQFGAPNYIVQSQQWWHQQAFQTKLDSIIATKMNGTNFQEIEKQLLRLWVITSRMLVDTDEGLIIASPNYQPKYFPCWIRDGCFQTLLWETLGEYNIVDNFLTKAIETISETNFIPLLPTVRYWRQCYSILPNTDNDHFMGLPYYPFVYPLLLHTGKWGLIEEDQMGEFLWLLSVIKQERGSLPQSITLNNNEYTKQIADYLQNIIVSDFSGFATGLKPGLLRASFDWYEWPENDGFILGPSGTISAFIDPQRAGVGQSVVTNAAAVKAFQFAFEITNDNKYEDAASLVESSVEENFILSNTPTTLDPPAYIVFADLSFFGFPPKPTFLTGVTPSIRPQLKKNAFASIFPFRLYNSEDWINSFHNSVNVLIQDEIEHKKCFLPSYLMVGLYEILKMNNPSKINVIVNGLKNDEIFPVKYIPENGYYTGTIFRGQGAKPLGWSNSWGALCILAKAGIKLKAFEY